MKKKLLALMLTIVMIGTLLPLQSFASGLASQEESAIHSMKSAGSGGTDKAKGSTTFSGSHSIATFDLVWKGIAGAHKDMVLEPLNQENYDTRSAIVTISFAIGGDETLPAYSTKITLPKGNKRYDCFNG